MPPDKEISAYADKFVSQERDTSRLVAPNGQATSRWQNRATGKLRPDSANFIHAKTGSVFERCALL